MLLLFYPISSIFFIVLNCSQTLKIENGQVDYSGIKAMYSCNQGFILKGETVRQCQHVKPNKIKRLGITFGSRGGGNFWSGVPPVCLRKQKSKSS